MNKYKTIPEFLEDQSPDKLEQINELRQIIMSAEPLLVENIKWNAPNYMFNGEDRMTLNVMNKEGKLKLILHMGASKKEDKKAPPVLADDTRLIDWNSDSRGTITFSDTSGIRAKRDQLALLVKRWLAS